MSYGLFVVSRLMDAVLSLGLLQYGSVLGIPSCQGK